MEALASKLHKNGKSQAHISQSMYILLQLVFITCNVPSAYQATDSFERHSFVPFEPLLVDTSMIMNVEYTATLGFKKPQCFQCLMLMS